MVAFNLSTAAGLAELEAHLTSRSYISGYTASRDDLAVYVALSSAPSAPHSARWYKHVTALLGSSFAGKAEGVSVGGAASAAVAADEDEVMDYGDDESEEELDLFGDETEEEKAAMAAKAEVIATAKARGEEKAKLSKSMIILDVKPWDDETDMAKLEAHVRAIVKDGLLWGTSTLVPIGFGIKKLQITCIIEDFKVPSFDEIIEDHIVMDGENEYIQSADIAAFNKL